jgi:hypothetical protein
MENKPNEPSGFETTQTNVNPETGTISWDIKYKADYALLYKRFKELNKVFKDFLTYDEIRKDPRFKEIGNGFNYLWNQLRTHLRSDYPEQYKKLQVLDENTLKELIRKSLGEESTTGAGANAATFTPGTGANYATPNAFNPNKKAKGAKNIYYYKLGWKPVDAEKLHKQSKAIDHKDLWTKKLEENSESSQSYVDSLNLQDPSLKQFVSTRVSDFDKIEDKLNTLLPLLKKAKSETMEFYKINPDYTIKYGTDLAIDYLDDLITLFKEKK